MIANKHNAPSAPRKGMRKLLGCRRGSSAIEFAIVSPVFLALMFSIFEVAWFYFVNATVDSATTDIARYIRTGSAQRDGYTGQDNRDDFFTDVVCPRLALFGECEARVTAEVEKFDTFADLAADTKSFTCRDDQPDEINNLIFEPGTDNAIVRVRLCLIYDTLNPAIGLSLAKNDAGQRRVTSSFILRVEPYSKKNLST